MATLALRLEPLAHAASAPLGAVRLGRALGAQECRQAGILEALVTLKTSETLPTLPSWTPSSVTLTTWECHSESKHFSRPCFVLRLSFFFLSFSP